LHGAARWECCFGRDDWQEDALGWVVRDGEDADRVRDVLDDCDGRVRALLDVLLLILLDQRRLERGAAGCELRWVDGGCGGGGREDLGGCGEDGLEIFGDFGGVRGSTGEDDLVDVEDVEAGLLDGGFDEAGEAVEDFAADDLVAQAVDGGLEVDTLGERLDGKGGVGSDREGLFAGFGLDLELGEGAGFLAWVGGVPFDELLGEVVHKHLV
jgi:hypothetical protein